MKEEWRLIVELDFLYSASNLGRIRSEPRMIIYGDHRTYRLEGFKIKKQSLSFNKKYYRVTTTDARKKVVQYAVHRLVSWAFLGSQSKGIEVRHINGNGLDNRIENLCYGTKSDNMRDAIEHRTFSMSDWHPCAKLTKEQVEEIRISGQYYKDAALKYNIHPFTVHKIRRMATRLNDD